MFGPGLRQPQCQVTRMLIPLMCSRFLRMAASSFVQNHGLPVVASSRKPSNTRTSSILMSLRNIVFLPGVRTRRILLLHGPTSSATLAEMLGGICAQAKFSFSEFKASDTPRSTNLNLLKWLCPAWSLAGRTSRDKFLGFGAMGHDTASCGFASLEG